MALPLIGGQTSIFFELGGKVRKIIKAYLGSYFADGVSFITQQQLSFLHSQVGQVVFDRQTISVFEYAVGVIRRQVNGISNFAVGNLFSKVFLAVLADLARNGGEEYVVLMDIAERQNISEKYLEGIVAALSRCGFLQTQRGRGGGYYMVDTPFELAELKLLVDAVYASKFITARKSKVLIEKLGRFTSRYRQEELDRKVLSDMAINDPEAFAALVEVSKAALK